jgi:hypothetical protein
MVAMVRLTSDAPGLLLAEHLEGEQAILRYMGTQVSVDRRPEP